MTSILGSSCDQASCALVGWSEVSWSWGGQTTKDGALQDFTQKEDLGLRHRLRSVMVCGTDGVGGRVVLGAANQWQRQYAVHVLAVAVGSFDKIADNMV